MPNSLRSLKFYTRRLICSALLLDAAIASAGAQATRSDSASSRANRVVVAAGAKYEAGWLHRFILGADYRDLWTTPIQVEVLDLRTVAGGLRPTQRGGSAQTISLRFEAANGREYVFRPLEKDFTRGLPPELKETLVRDVAQDQVAGYHPAAPLVVARLLDATGLHHPRPRMVVMPNDTLLGEFRADFAGVIGTFEERPTEDFGETPESPGATNVISSERLFERLRTDPDERVNSRAFLAARLFDILVGDRDRHRDQWRWGRFSTERNAPWEPIPRDRDMPFARFEGLGPWVVRGASPQLVTFTERYPDMVWLNWNAREIDRLLLSPLERPAWDSATSKLQAQLSDAVIDSAIAAMPAEFVKLDGQRLRNDLIIRRDNLPSAARSFYRILASEVDFRGTDESDLAQITRAADGSVLVELFAESSLGRSPGAPPYRQRRFDPADTREVRIFLNAKDDRVVIRGAQSRDITVRIIGGEGDDTVIDSIPGGDRALRFYDSAGNNRIESAANTPIARDTYKPPATDRPEHSVRDWGSWVFMQRTASYSPTVGFVASLSQNWYRYGFRRDPYESHSALRLDFSFGELRPRLTYEGTFRPMRSENLIEVQLMASGLELIRFHGLGNETPSDSGTSYYRVFQNLFRAEQAWVLRSGKSATWTLGGLAQYTATREGQRTVVGTTQPYGSGTFGEIGAKVSFVVDSRDLPNNPSKGARFAVTGTLFPPIWDVQETFGTTQIEGATYLSPKAPLAPTLALRAGAHRAWGTFPFHEASFLGGSGTLRGWDEQRFAGRSSLFGSAELRFRFGKLRILVPADVGGIGFADVGRVFVDDENSNAWHTGVGGGVWIAPITRMHTVSASFAIGPERTGFYFKSGFAF